MFKTIVKQSLSADEIVIVDSGDKNIKEKIKKIIKNSDIKLVYYFKKLSRVKALNKAIILSNSKYLIRFDTRTRFH